MDQEDSSHQAGTDAVAKDSAGAPPERREVARKVVQSPEQDTRGFLQRKSWGEGSYTPRVDAIAPLVRGKRVLDLGCASGKERSDWVHGQIAGIAGSLVGVDVDEPAVRVLQQRGFDIRLGDAEALELGERFDVVLAGELIEHLDCFRGLFDTARRHLVPGGVLVITTPNAFAISNFVYRIGGEVRVNADHTCWFCETTLRQLVEREDFEVVSMDYLHFRSPGRLRGRLAALARSVLPERLAWSTLVAVVAPR